MLQPSWYQKAKDQKVTCDTIVEWGKYKGKKHVYLLYDRTYCDWLEQRTAAGFAKSTKQFLFENNRISTKP